MMLALFPRGLNASLVRPRIMRNQPVRLLLVASSSHLGGAERSILNLVRHSDPSRLMITVLTLMGQGPLARMAQQAGAMGGFNWALEKIARPALLRRMQVFLREGRYDLVQTFGLRADLITRWVAHGQGIKVISSIRSVDEWRKARHVALDRLTADGVTAWISNSEAGKRAKVLREGAPARRVYVVPNGIPDRAPPDSDRRARARRRFKIAEGAGPVVAVVANLTRAKGHADLIAATARVARDLPTITFLCAGRDDSAGAIPQLALDQNVNERFNWLGFQSDPGLVFDAADFAVLPSHWEGMPHSLIEALRAGLPSVATQVGGVPEVIRDGEEGLLCEPKNPAALAETIIRMAADKKLRAGLGENARRRYEAHFRVETMVEGLTEIYERVAGLAV